MSGGVKYDSGKPQLSMVSRELVESVAQVRMFGANKYTTYGECVCVVNVIKNLSIQETSAGAATTNGLKQKIRNTKEPSLRTTQSGQSNTDTILRYITGDTGEIKQQPDTVYLEPKLISFLKTGANYVGGHSDFASIMTTQPDAFGGLYVPRATLESDGWKNMIGKLKHEPTCSALKIVRPGRDNWKKGFKVTRSCDAALRHIFQFLSGEDTDPESGLSHLAHAVCAIEHAIYDMKHHPENDDRVQDGPVNPPAPTHEHTTTPVSGTLLMQATSGILSKYLNEQS